MSKYMKIISSLPRLVKWFLFTELLFGLGIGLWNINLNFYLKAEGYRNTQIGIIFAISPIVTAIFSVFAGSRCDRYGYRLVMIIGCLVKAVGMVLTASGFNNYIVCLGRIGNGIGDALVLTSVYPFIISLVEAELKNTVYNLLFSMNLFAIFAGNILGGYLPDFIKVFSNSYKFTLIMSSIIILLTGISRILLPDSRIVKPENSIMIILPKENAVRWFFVFGLLGYTEYFLVSSMLNLICKEQFGFSSSMVGIIIGTSTIMASISIFVIPVLVNRFDRKYLTVITIGTLVAVYLLMAVVGSKLFMAFIVISNVLSIMVAGLLDSPMLSKIKEGERGTYSGVRLLMNNAGTGLGIVSAGVVLDHAGYQVLFMIASLLLLMQFFVYYYGFRYFIPVDDIKSNKALGIAA